MSLERRLRDAPMVPTVDMRRLSKTKDPKSRLFRGDPNSSEWQRVWSKRTGLGVLVMFGLLLVYLIVIAVMK